MIGRDENAFVMGFIEYLAEKDGMDGSELLSMVSQRLAREIPPVARQDHLSVMEILSGISSRIRGHDRDRAGQESGERGPGRGINRAVPGSPVPGADTGPCGFESLKKLLVDAMVHGAPMGFDAGWERLVRKYPAQARRIILRYGKEPEVRRKIAHTFSESGIRALIELVEPEHGGFIESLAERPEMFYRAESVENSDVGLFKKQLWTFVLTYLFVDRGSRFNKKTFTRSMIHQLATHYNMAYEALVTSLRQVIAVTEADTALKDQMLHMLSEFEEESKGHRAIRKAPDPESQKTFRAYDLYEALMFYLRNGRLPPGRTPEGGRTGVAEIIEELEREHPGQLLRLFKELHGLPGLIGRVTAGVSIDLLERLVSACLSMAAPAGEAHSSNLREAVATFARAAGDRRGYYAHILESIVHGRTIDFETIAAWNKNGEEDQGDIRGIVPEKDGDRVGAAPDREQRAQEDLPRYPDQGREALLFEYLRGGRKAADTSARTCAEYFETMLIYDPERLYRFIRKHLGDRAITGRMIALLPDRLLTRVLHILVPDSFLRYQRYADIVRDALYSFTKTDGPAGTAGRVWEAVFLCLGEAGLRVPDEKEFIRRILEYCASEACHGERGEFYSRLSRQLAMDMRTYTRAEQLAVMDVVREMSEIVPGSAPLTGVVEMVHDSVGVPEENEEQEFDEVIYVLNAGMVLSAPYLPRMFKMLDLVNESRFKSRNAAERAVHLLQFMVNEEVETPEYQLVLNKILCGVKPGIPIGMGIEITPGEREHVEGLIEGMIRNWKVLGKTSVNGFRESFLQREGRLQLKDNAWDLLVEPRPFDMLLDRIPWGFSTIKHPWMDRVIHVKWR